MLVALHVRRVIGRAPAPPRSHCRTAPTFLSALLGAGAVVFEVFSLLQFASLQGGCLALLSSHPLHCFPVAEPPLAVCIKMSHLSCFVCTPTPATVVQAPADCLVMPVPLMLLSLQCLLSPTVSVPVASAMHLTPSTGAATAMLPCCKGWARCNCRFGGMLDTYFCMLAALYRQCGHLGPAGQP